MPNKNRIIIGLYQIHSKLIDINCLYLPFSSKENISVAILRLGSALVAMQIFYFSINKNIIQFINPSTGNVIGIKHFSIKVFF